jgi:hypothetical protein
VNTPLPPGTAAKAAIAAITAMMAASFFETDIRMSRTVHLDEALREGVARLIRRGLSAAARWFPAKMSE